MVYVAPRAGRFLRGLFLTSSTALLVGLLASAIAMAGKGVVAVFGGPGSGDGQFANALGTAVDLSSGDVYVVDQFDHRVERFDASGAFLGAFGWGVADGTSVAQTCSTSCQSGIAGAGDGQFDTPQGIAIRQSDGAVFVVDGNNNRVEQFDAAGVYQSQFASAGTAEGQLSGPQGIAVDQTDGSVYVADAGNNRVQKFDNAGAFVQMFGFGVADGTSAFQTCMGTCQAGLAVPDEGGFSGPTRVATDSTGRVYVLDSGNGRIERYTSANAFDQVFDPADVFAPQEIAIGPANDDLYVAQWSQDFSEQRVVQIASAGSLVDTHGIGSSANNSSGLAVGATNEKVYLADGSNARVLILDDVTAPDVTIDPAAGVTSTDATLSGTVNPNGNPDMSWRFEISTDDANWSPAAGDQDPGSGNSPVPVTQALAGLVPNTTYFARLVARRAFNAPAISSEVQFSTGAIPPDVTSGVADDVTPDHAVLQGLIHPHNSPTTYYFEYGTTAAYGTSVPATQDGDAGTSNQRGLVLQRLDGLLPGTTYHYRLVAHNQAATTQGADQTFTTGTRPLSSTARAGIPGTGFLPDDRGWEKVSPAHKNGGDIMADSQRMRVAADGNAASFASLAAFGDAAGTSVATDYLSNRGSDGWATHAIIPPQAPLTIKPILVSIQTLYTGPFSDDLSKGLLAAWSPVTDDPSVAKVANLYIRTDLKTPGAGSYQLVSACPLCVSTGTPLPPLLGNISGGGAPFFAGASSDYSHVIFESQQPLTADAPSGCTNLADLSQCPGNLYEWDHGVVRLVGVLPDTACGTPPCLASASQAGQGAGSFQAASELTPHTISADGSRIIFTVPDSPGAQQGSLFMRIAHSSTVHLNATERVQVDPGNPVPATYWDASADGTHVFFLTTEALTDDSPIDGNRKLYMYDATRPATDPHNLVLISPDEEPSDGGDVVNVLGASSDGQFVYFAAAGQLIAGQPPLGVDRGLYVWHAGSLTFITSMKGFADDPEDTNTIDWTFRIPTARVTPNGTLLFSSTLDGSGPTGYDQSFCTDNPLGAGCRQLYMYSFESHRLSCASCNPSNDPATFSAFTGLRTNNSVALTTWAQNQPITADGRRVFFSTGEALVAQDRNGRIDVYEFDVRSGTVHLITSGRDRSDAYFMNASPSGTDVFFLTREQLVGSDHDKNYDVYDARIGGGFAEPRPESPCIGDACQGSAHAAPDAGVPGTSLTQRLRNAPAKPRAASKSTTKRRAKPCRKGYVRRKVRHKPTCVKARKHRRITKAKRAHARRPK